MDVVNNILESLLNSFDFAYCFVVNIATYFAIKLVNAFVNRKKDKPKVDISEWTKRIILVIIILFTGVLYKFINADDLKVLINSAILTPVSWSWIFKPIFKMLNLDYKKKYNGQE